MPVAFLLGRVTGAVQYLPRVLSPLAVGEPPRITDWIQAVAAGVTAVASLLLLLTLLFTSKQIALAKEELRLGTTWNRLNATFSFFSTDTFEKAERTAIDALEAAGILVLHRESALASEEVEKILNNVNAWAAVKQWLSTLEDYAVAVRCGALDEPASFAMMRHQVPYSYRLFAPLVARRRQESGDMALYCELEQLTTAWEQRSAEEVASQALDRSVKPRV